MIAISCRIAAMALAFLLLTPGSVPSGFSSQALADPANSVPVAQEDSDDGPVCSDFDGDGECDIAPPHD